MTKLVPITILVPIDDIEIIDALVSHEEERDDEPGGYDVHVAEICIAGLKYEIEDWNEKEVDEKAIQEWKDK